MNRNNQNDSGNQQQQDNLSENQNPTLNDPAASSVADYGKSEQNLEELEEKHGRNSGKGNSSIPLDKEDTIGNP